MREEFRHPRVCGKRFSRLLQRYYLGPEHPMKQRIWSWFRRMRGHPRLTVSCAGQGWITTDERDFIDQQILLYGSYEPEVWGALARFAHEGDVVWDVGAHIGSFAIQALQDARVREVHAFEPDPLNASILALNLSLNNGRHEVHRIGLSHQREVRRLYHGPVINTGLSSFSRATGDRSFWTECRSADELVFEQGLPPPTLLKVDVEGWEDGVFQGAERLLQEVPPTAIVFETASHSTGQILRLAAADRLESLGYSLKHILRPSGVVLEVENFLAVHHPSASCADGPDRRE